MLAVEGLEKRYRGIHRSITVVQNISFTVPQGTFFTLLGPSGCGKTTTLRCIAGLERPDGGTIQIGNETVFSATVFVPPERRPIGMVFQSYAIWPHMTVFENAAFPLRYGRVRHSPAEVRRRVGEMLEKVGLNAWAEQWATQLSGGQQQRLALARALLCEPQLLLLDEPLSNLDAKLRASMRNELKAFQRLLGVTTIYVTHDQGEALALSDNIAVLDQGVIQQMGPPQTLYSAPANAFVARFIGDSNVWPGRIRVEQGDWWVECALGALRCAAHSDVTQAEVMACIHPEGIRVRRVPFPSPTVNVFPATVTSVEFLGDRQELQLVSAHLPLTARQPMDGSIREGNAVWVHCPPEAIWVVPDAPSQRASSNEPLAMLAWRSATSVSPLS